jgi:hypothetical protein
MLRLDAWNPVEVWLDAMTTPDELSGNRALCVGITGHRCHRLASMDEPLLRRRMRAIFAWLLALRDQPAPLAAVGLQRRFSMVAVLSALAEGADQMAAEEALRLECVLRCALPFLRDEYEADFSTCATLKAYHALLARAIEVEELPGSRASEEAAYANVGHLVLARSDLLLAVWDGGEAHGIGGTASIVASAVRRELPIIWIDARLPHRIRLLTHSGQSSPIDITDWFPHTVDA